MRAQILALIELVLQYEVTEIFDLLDPDITPANHRSKLRKEREKEDFNEDHYLADYFNSEVMEDAMKYVAPWEKDMEQTSKFIFICFF